MSKAYISRIFRQKTHERFDGCCAYCLTPEWIIGTAFTIDHIIPEALGGKTVLENLCLACFPCNLIKGTQTTAIDLQTEQHIPLFHPYQERWSDHFSWQSFSTEVI